MAVVSDLSQGRFWVYFVDTAGTISIYKGPTEAEDPEANTPYEGPSTIQIGTTNIKTHPDAPKLAVVDYKTKAGVWEVRLTATVLYCLS